MVALSKLLVGALVQSAFGMAEFGTETSAAQSSAPTATIEETNCNNLKQQYGQLIIKRVGVADDDATCSITSVGVKDNKLYAVADCKIEQIFAVVDSSLSLDMSDEGEPYFFELFAVYSPVEIVHNGDDTYEEYVKISSSQAKYEGQCLKLTNKNGDVYEIKIGLMTNDQKALIDDKKELLPKVQMMDYNGDIVEKSAFFGTRGGEWDFIDLVGIVAACVLVCCLGLALYGCWSKKQKQEAEQRQTKYVAQNSNPSGRTGTQRRRR